MAGLSSDAAAEKPLSMRGAGGTPRGQGRHGRAPKATRDLFGAMQLSLRTHKDGDVTEDTAVHSGTGGRSSKEISYAERRRIRNR